jgi:hypothetical protein
MLLIRLCFIIKQFPRNSKFEKNKKKEVNMVFFFIFESERKIHGTK